MAALRAIAATIDAINTRIGRTVAWLCLLMVLLQLAIVIGRYVFGIGSVLLQEALIYMHALIFLLAAAYTLRTDDHVRVDIFYREAAPRWKAQVNFAGALLFVIPLALLIILVSWNYVLQSWLVLEGSRETSGIPAIFLLKTAILVFAVQIAAQGASLAIHSILALRGDPDEVAALRTGSDPGQGA